MHGPRRTNERREGSQRCKGSERLNFSPPRRPLRARCRASRGPVTKGSGHPEPSEPVSCCASQGNLPRSTIEKNQVYSSTAGITAADSRLAFVQRTEQVREDRRTAGNFRLPPLSPPFFPRLGRLHLSPVLDDVVEDGLPDIGVRDRNGTEQLGRCPFDRQSS